MLVHSCLGPVVHVTVDISHWLYMCGVHEPLFEIGNENLKCSFASGLVIASVIIYAGLGFIRCWLFDNVFVKCACDTARAPESLCRTWLRVWDSFSALAGELGSRLFGGAVPAAAAPRHRHHSPRNEPRVRWEGWAVRVGSVPRCWGKNPAVTQAVYMDTCERQTLRDSSGEPTKCPH